jgi:phage shock protein PspC (stress-responsive transcriptional regulator)
MSTYGDTQYDDTDQDTGHQDTGYRNTGQAGTGAGRRPLRRAVGGRMLAGVCAGLADYFEVDVTIVRAAFAVFTFLGGAGVPAYLACLLLIPEEGHDQSIAGDLLDSVQHGL